LHIREQKQANKQINKTKKTKKQTEKKETKPKQNKTNKQTNKKKTNGKVSYGLGKGGYFFVFEFFPFFHHNRTLFAHLQF
jgi:hypothetical protein